MSRTQSMVLKWTIDSFGETARNQGERAARLVEESIEVAQAAGLPAEVISLIVKRVYSRPPGELGREIGGVGLTLEGFAEVVGLNAESETEREWQRVNTKTKEWWAKRHAAKVRAGTADLGTTR